MLRFTALALIDDSVSVGQESVDLSCRTLYALKRHIMVHRVDDTSKIFMHIGLHKILTLQEFRRQICKIRADKFIEHAVSVELIKLIDAFCEETESDDYEYPARASGFDLLTDIQHGASGCDHIVNDDAVLALNSIA